MGDFLQCSESIFDYMKERRMNGMNEKDYLSLLDEALLNRGVVERQKILDDYRQHFSDGRIAGQSDDEAIRQDSRRS